MKIKIYLFKTLYTLYTCFIKIIKEVLESNLK